MLVKLFVLPWRHDQEKLEWLEVGVRVALFS